MTTLDTPVCGCCGHGLAGDRETWAVCAFCEDRVLADLAVVAGLWRELPGWLQPGRTGPAGPRVATSRSAAPLPLREAVLDLVGPGGVPDRLMIHQDAWRAAQGATITPWSGSADQRLSDVVRYLQTHLGWACRHYGTDDLAADLRRLIGEMRAATGQADEPDPQAQLRMSCPRCTRPLHYDPGARAITCRSCAVHLPVRGWLDYAADLRRAAERRPA